MVELNRRFLHGYGVFKDEPRLQALLSNVLKYNRLLQDLGLRDHQVSPSARFRHGLGLITTKVSMAQRASWKTLGLLLYRIGLLSAWSIFALPGVILNGPIFLTASILSKKKAKGTRRYITVCGILHIFISSCHLRGRGSISGQDSRSRCNRDLESIDISWRRSSAIQLLRRYRYHTCHQSEMSVEMEADNATSDYHSATRDRVRSTQIW